VIKTWGYTVGLSVEDAIECKGYYRVNVNSNINCIFLNETDYYFLLSLLEKYLLDNVSVEILAYCLEPSYFNLLLFQKIPNSIDKLLHNLTVDYNQYFYDKYNIEDLLSETGHDIKKVFTDDLLNVSRFIHSSPSVWIDYPHSSIRAYFYDDKPKWLNKDHISKLCSSAVKYSEFMKSF